MYICIEKQHIVANVVLMVQCPGRSCLSFTLMIPILILISGQPVKQHGNISSPLVTSCPQWPQFAVWVRETETKRRKQSFDRCWVVFLLKRILHVSLPSVSILSPWIRLQQHERHNTDQKKFNFQCREKKKEKNHLNLTTWDIRSINEVKPLISTQPETSLTWSCKRSTCQHFLVHQPLTELLFVRVEKNSFVSTQHKQSC